MRPVAAFAAAAFLSLSHHALADVGEVGRFQLAPNTDLYPMVIDTKTGELWVLLRTGENAYVMQRICYAEPGGSLTPSANSYVNTIPHDRFQALCEQR